MAGRREVRKTGTSVRFCGLQFGRIGSDGGFGSMRWRVLRQVFWRGIGLHETCALGFVLSNFKFTMGFAVVLQFVRLFRSSASV